MILRPVTPQSPTGPPMTNRPVGLMKNLVFASIICAGSTGLMISSITASLSASYPISGLCWVERTTASMRRGRLSSYSMVTWLLASGRSQDRTPPLRTSDWRLVRAWAKVMGMGMSTSVSSQA